MNITTFKNNRTTRRLLLVAFGFLSLLLPLSKAQASCVNSVDADTIALYHLEDLTDSASYGDLTNTGASGGASGHCNNAYDFPTGADLVATTSTPSGVASNTIILSVKLDSNPGVGSYMMASKFIHDSGSGGAEEYWYVHNVGGTMHLTYDHNNASEVALDYVTDIAGTGWHNLISSYNADTGKCFAQLDGVTFASSTSCVLLASWSDSLTIGSNENQTLGWDGQIDEVIVKRTAMTEAEATAYYSTCWVGADCGGGGSSVSASFAFPHDGSSTADFSNWVVNVNAPVNEGGEIRVYYATNDSTAGFMDRAPITSVDDAIVTPLVIHKTRPLVGYYSTSTWVAYIVVNNAEGATIYTSSPIVFHLNGTIPTMTSSTILAGPFNPQYLQNSSTTYSTSSLELFGFEQGAFNFVTQQWMQFRSVFPFSIVFGFASTTEDAIRNASTSNANYDLYVNTTLLGMQVRFPILTSTTMEFVIGSSTTRTIFDIERKLLWLGTGAFILFTIL